jgi:hypothetical protein
MRSKWLEWKPEAGLVGFEGSQSAVSLIIQASDCDRLTIPGTSPDAIMENAVACEPTKPTEFSSAAQSTPLLERPPYFWDKHGDAYGWRAHISLDAICEIPAPEGLIVWLDEHSPFLYRRLTRDLPNAISRAWDDQASHEDFDILCSELVETYRRAVELYRTSACAGRM